MKIIASHNKEQEDKLFDKVICAMSSKEESERYILEQLYLLSKSGTRSTKEFISFLLRLPHFLQKNHPLYLTFRMANDKRAKEGTYDIPLLPHSQKVFVDTTFALSKKFAGFCREKTDKVNKVAHYRLTFLEKNARAYLNEQQICPEKIVPHEVIAEELTDHINKVSEQFSFIQKVGEVKVQPERVDDITLDIHTYSEPHTLADSGNIYQEDEIFEVFNDVASEIFQSEKSFSRTPKNKMTEHVLHQPFAAYSESEQSGWSRFTSKMSKIPVLSKEEMLGLTEAVQAGILLRKKHEILLKLLQLRYYPSVMHKMAPKVLRLFMNGGTSEKEERDILCKNHGILPVSSDDIEQFSFWLECGNIDSFENVELLQKILLICGDEIHEHQQGSRKSFTKHHFSYLFDEDYLQDRNEIHALFGVEIPHEYEEKTASTAMKARKKMFEHNQRLVLSIANKLCAQNEKHDVETAFQYGSMGLFYAIEDYNPRLGQFSTFAYPRITVIMKRGLDEEEGAYVSQRHREVHTAYKKVQEEYQREKGEKISLSEAAKVMNVAEETVLRAVTRHKTQSIDAPLGSTTDAEMTLADSLSSDDIALEDAVVMSDSQEYIRTKMKRVLSLREYDIVSSHYGLETGESEAYVAIGERMGISKQRVQQILVKAKEKLARVLKDFQ